MKRKAKLICKSPWLEKERGYAGSYWLAPYGLGWTWFCASQFDHLFSVPSTANHMRVRLYDTKPPCRKSFKIRFRRYNEVIMCRKRWRGRWHCILPVARKLLAATLFDRCADKKHTKTAWLEIELEETE